MKKFHQELRCTCRTTPLLGTYGVDENKKLYVHVKIFKQSRIFGEIICHGDVKIRCRECFRWHKIYFRPEQQSVELQEIPPASSGDPSTLA